jgi:hypothetical protein
VVVKNSNSNLFFDRIPWFYNKVFEGLCKLIIFGRDLINQSPTNKQISPARASGVACPAKGGADGISMMDRNNMLIHFTEIACQPSITSLSFPRNPEKGHILDSRLEISGMTILSYVSGWNEMTS